MKDGPLIEYNNVYLNGISRFCHNEEYTKKEFQIFLREKKIK